MIRLCQRTHHYIVFSGGNRARVAGVCIPLESLAEFFAFLTDNPARSGWWGEVFLRIQWYGGYVSGLVYGTRRSWISERGVGKVQKGSTIEAFGLDTSDLYNA